MLGLPALRLGRPSGGRRGVPILPWPLALAIVVVLHIASAWFLRGLHLNNAPEVYYPPGSAAVALRDELRKEFPSDEVLTLVFQGKDVYTRDFLLRMQQLSESLKADPMVDRVSSVLSLERISGTEEDFKVEPLVGKELLERGTPQQIRERVLADRFAPGLLASKDGTLLAVAVRPKQMTESSQRLALKVAALSAIQAAGLQGHFAGDAGPVTVDVAQLQSVLEDTARFVPLTALIGMGLLWWVVGRIRPVVIGGIAMSTTVTPMIAGIAATGQPYTMATAILPNLLGAYTLATLMHLYAGVQHAQGFGGTRRQAVNRALAETIKPGAFNVLTTAAGLLSLVLVPIPPIQVFGIAGAAGTALVFLTVYFLVPPLLVSFDNRRWPQRASGMGFFARVSRRLPVWSMRHPRWILGGAALLCLAAIPLAKGVKAESDMLKFFSPAHPVNLSTDLIEAKLSGVTSIEILLRGSGRDSLQDVERLKAMRQFQDWLEALPEVDRTASMVDLVEEMHWAMNGEKPAFRAVPDSGELVSQYLLVYDGRDLWEFVNRDFERARILVSLNVHGAKEIGRVIQKIRDRAALYPLPGISLDVGGYGRLFADQVELLVTGQANSFLGAFVQIFVFMLVLWRSFGASAICMVPNLAPLFFIFVLMGASGINLDLATVMIAGVVLGITVDDTIHLYYGYRERIRRGVAPALAVARSFQTSGRAVLAISVLLTAQFGLLATSDFVPTSNFGLMTAVGLLAGQAAEILLMPALLVTAAGVARTGWRSLLQPQRRSRAIDLPAATEWQPTMLVERPATAQPVSRDTALDEVPESLPPPPDGTSRSAGGMIVRAEPAATARLPILLVCTGDACRARGADAVWAAAQRARDDHLAADLALAARPVESGCLGCCDAAPAMALVAEMEAPIVVAESAAERAKILVTGRPDPG